MQLKVSQFLPSILLGGYFAASAMAADDIQYAAIKNEDGKWKVESISDTIPTYKDGMEILALPSFVPQFDKRFQEVRSQYGGIECPIVPDKTMYTPCNTYFFRFVGANWFGLGGIRVSFDQARLGEVNSAIASDETIKAIKAKAEETAEAKAQASREAGRLRNARMQQESSVAVEKSSVAVDKKQRLIAGNLEKMAKMERGVEDSCKRNLKHTAGPGGMWSFNNADPDYAEITCQFGGEVTLEGLGSAGWLVVNKNVNSDNVVTGYYIRKAR